MTLVIGDIHGCYNELMQLLDKSGIADDEPIIALGDILDRGPDPLAVLSFFIYTDNAYSLRGNHEQKHLDAYKKRTSPNLSQLVTCWKLRGHYDEALCYMREMPLYMELDEALLVHGYYDPRKSPDRQRQGVLLGQKKGRKYLRKKLDEQWFRCYSGDKPIIVGHKDYSKRKRPFNYKDRVFGLDTQCVKGGALTAIRLPQWDIVTVPAKKNHWKRVKRKFRKK